MRVKNTIQIWSRFKQGIIEEVVKIPLETIHKFTAKWPERLQLCIDDEGGYFE